MLNRNKQKIAKSATAMILGAGVYYTLIAVSKGWDDDEEKDGKYPLPTGIYSSGEIVRYGKNRIERYTVPVNCLVSFGRVIPLSLFGTIGIGSIMVATSYDNFIKSEEKKKDKVIDPDNPEMMLGWNSFVKSSGNAVINMSAYSSLSELGESIYA